MSHEPVQTISGGGDIDGASVGGHEHGHMSWSLTPSRRLSHAAAASLHVGEPVAWRVVGEPVVREYDRQRFWPSHDTAAFVRLKPAQASVAAQLAASMKQSASAL